MTWFILFLVFFSTLLILQYDALFALLAGAGLASSFLGFLQSFYHCPETETKEEQK